MFNNIESDEQTETRRIEIQSMAQLVYGKPVKRVRLPSRLIFIAAVTATLYGCATGAKPVSVEIETVGNLSASATHVYVAPVHATTDFAPAANVADSGDDLPKGKASLDVLRDEAARAGTVDVAAKDDGVTVGGAR